MLRPLAAVLVMTTAAAAAPGPKPESEADRFARLFGTAVDPDKDCTFKLDGAKLTITVPDTPHGWIRPTRNAPRVVRAARGDFVARVKVTSRMHPEGISGIAGLVVYQDDRNFAEWAVMRRAAAGAGRLVATFLRDGQPRAFATRGVTEWTDAADAEAGRVWFRLTRAGSSLAYEVSSDGGATWRHLGLNEGAAAARDVKVGVFASNPGSTPFTATFEDFTVGPLTETK